MCELEWQHAGEHRFPDAVEARKHLAEVMAERDRLAVLARKFETQSDAYKAKVSEVEAQCRKLDGRHEQDVFTIGMLEVQLDQARQAADEWATKTREYEHVFGPLLPGSGSVLRADDAVALPTTTCPHSKAKQFGPATYVVRRCKLVDGHDGICEPG